MAINIQVWHSSLIILKSCHTRVYILFFWNHHSIILHKHQHESTCKKRGGPRFFNRKVIKHLSKMELFMKSKQNNRKNAWQFLFWTSSFMGHKNLTALKVNFNIIWREITAQWLQSLSRIAQNGSPSINFTTTPSSKVVRGALSAPPHIIKSSKQEYLQWEIQKNVKFWLANNKSAKIRGRD